MAKNENQQAKMSLIVVNFPTKNAYLPIKHLYLPILKGKTMYRDKLVEFKKEKGISTKQWSIESGVSIDTINRIIHPEHLEKDSPRVNTLEDLCKPLGVELWEIFYLGDRSFVSVQAELTALKAERDALVAENGALKNKVDTLRDKVDTLKDEIIATHNYYIKLKSNN